MVAPDSLKILRKAKSWLCCRWNRNVKKGRLCHVRGVL